MSRELIKAVARERRLRSLEVRNKKVEIQTSPLEPSEGLVAVGTRYHIRCIPWGQIPLVEKSEPLVKRVKPAHENNYSLFQ